MANTKLSDIGTSVVGSAGAIKMVSALGDGTAKAGDAVGILSTGKVVQADVGVSENFIGFLKERYDIDIDTAITDALPVQIVIPESGKTYNVLIEDPAGTELKGTPYLPSDTAGAHEAAAAITTAGVNSSLAKDVATGDLYGTIRWK